MANLPTRNNNPGAIRNGPDSFHKFENPQEGYAALLNDLTAKQSGNTSTGLGPNSSLAEFANKYAPPSDGNDSAKYAADLANQLGVAPDTPIGQLDVAKWAEAISKNEGFQGQYHTYNPQPFSNPSAGTQNPASAMPGVIDFSGLPTVVEPESQKSGGGLIKAAGNVLAKAQAPFIGAAAIPTQLLAKGLGKPDPFAGGVPAGIPGMGQKADVTPLSFLKKAGDIAQVGSYAVPGARGLKAIAGGTTTGLLQGAGSAMSEGKNLTETAVRGALGAGTGGLLVGGTQLAGKALSRVGDSLSGEGVKRATEGVKNAYSKALNLNAAERGFESRSGKDIAQVLLDLRAPLGRNPDGTLDATEAIGKIQEALNPLNKVADDIVNRPELNQNAANFLSLDNVGAKLIDTIKKSSLDPLEKLQSVEQAQKLLQAAKAEYGDMLAPRIAEKLKQALQGTAFKKNLQTTDALQNNVTYQLSKILRSDIETALGPQGAEYAAVNAQRSDLVDAAKRLTKLDGVRTVVGGRLGNMSGGIVGTIAGAASGLGTAGALAGDFFGRKAAEIINNPATQIGVAQARAKAAGVIPGLVGRGGAAVGKGITGVGNAVGKAGRLVGLVGNLLTNK